MTTVVKIGGNVIDNPDELRTFIADFAAMPGRKVLVHGGGKVATQISSALGIQTQMIEGRRVTDAQTIDVVTMVYGGLINKRIVAQLQSKGCNSIGLSGADGNVIAAHRRPAKPIDYGFVGDIDRVNADLIVALLNQGVTPVFCALTHDGAGNMLNCNADTIASSVATALAAKEPTELIYCFEKAGVMLDVDDPTSVIPTVDAESFARLKAEGTVHSGMLPKLENALHTVGAGVSSVIIKHSRSLTDPTAGTTIKA
jgi:acetylglutamate kinase